MPPSDDDERLSLVDADSVAASADSTGSGHLPEQQVVDEHGAGDDPGGTDVKYSAQFLVSIVKPVSGILCPVDELAVPVALRVITRQTGVFDHAACRCHHPHA